MSEPQSQEIWKEKPKAGFGVEMSEQQFEKMMGHLNHLTSETERREAAVANSLNELKQIEAVRTYASVVRDITTSIQTLSQIEGTDKIVDQLVKSLSITNNNFHSMGVVSIGQEANQQALSVQTNSETTK